jgi:hypothetical protein
MQLHNPVFKVEPHARDGFVVCAQWSSGEIETLIGLYTSEEAAQDWIDHHTAEWARERALARSAGGPVRVV